MSVLVTGATGFLGSHVVALLRERGTEVRALVRPGRDRSWLEARGVRICEGDLLDEHSLRQACRGTEGLIHCAVMRGNWSPRNLEQHQVNVEGTCRLYRTAHDHGVARIVHVSSTATLGANRDGRVLTESSAFNIGHLQLSYVDTKLEAEESALADARAGMPIVIVNPCMLVGPRFDGRVPAPVARARRGRPRFVPAGGVSVADVEDVAAATIAALERGRPGERTILGGHNLTWRGFHAAVAHELGTRPPSFVVPGWAAWALERGAGALDLVGLSRPRWAPEVFRIWGWYAFVDSGKAIRELGHRIRPLDAIVRRMAHPAG